MYVTKSDYKGRITVELLNILLQEDEPGILQAASDEAEGALLTKAGVLYDVAGELAKTGTARNGYLLGLAKSIGLYEIYQRADDADVPKKVIKNRDDAMATLNEISLGKAPLALPPKPTDPPSEEPGNGEEVTPGGTGLRRMGSQPKRTHNI